MKKFLTIALILLLSICYAQTIQISKNRLNEYKSDLSILLDIILFKRIVCENKTCPEATEEMYNTSKTAYKKLLKDKNDLQEKQNMLYSYGVISAFPKDICDEFHNVISKYKIDYYDDFASQNLDCQFYYAQRFLKLYRIKDTNKYVKFIKKMDLYQQKMYKMQSELDLF